MINQHSQDTLRLNQLNRLDVTRSRFYIERHFYENPIIGEYISQLELIDYIDLLEILSINLTIEKTNNFNYEYYKTRTIPTEFIGTQDIVPYKIDGYAFGKFMQIQKCLLENECVSKINKDVIHYYFSIFKLYEKYVTDDCIN